MFKSQISGAAVILFGVFVWALANQHPIVAGALAVQWFMARGERRRSPAV